jgi:hypothetical protein
MTKTDTMKMIIIGGEGPTKTDTHNLMMMKRVGLINGTPASELACMIVIVRVSELSVLKISLVVVVVVLRENVSCKCVQF